MSDAFELEICQGKYRYRYEAGKQEVWRNGYIWQTLNGKLIGDKFVFSLAVELDEALKERDALRAKLEATEEDRSRFLVEMGRLCTKCDALRTEIEELHALIAAVKKQAAAEFRLRVKKEEEYTRLRAKITEMEKQGCHA